MASALRQEWILIRRLGESAALCVLPARSAGQLLCRPCVRYGRVGERRAPASWARSRDTTPAEWPPQLGVAVTRGKPVRFAGWRGGSVHASAWR